ncbi:hypothetical protein OV079_20685 [Nannocystis pusilla]|uniref:Uncharacterized protein n=1 Tax=Nannocystis pusilla TaxID=889268 RepID=A0A9X3EPS8_9BACT|nr:hypothetical protein [Nannocystis pusilla]MCY1007927.1 hypothetical protein [Nannocystis pusilla]
MLRDGRAELARLVPPFAAPGAPAGERLGGVAMLGERLYVFAGE